jgi:hypothetical protein
MLVLCEDGSYRGPASLNRREQIFDVCTAYAENVFDAQRDDPIDDEFGRQHRPEESQGTCLGPELRRIR